LFTHGETLGANSDMGVVLCLWMVTTVSVRFGDDVIIVGL